MINFIKINVILSFSFLFNIVVAESTPTEPNVSASDEQRLKDLTIKVNQLKEDKKSVDMAFQRESNKRDALKKALLGDKGEGCYGSLPLTELSLIIRGSNTLPKFLGHGEKEKGGGSAPNTIVISFGNEMTHSLIEPVLSSKGETTFLGDKFKNFTIADIKYIAFEKQGFKIEAKNVGPDKLWGSDKYDNTEYDIYQIADVTLKNGSITIYQATVNQTFERGNLKWIDEKFKDNKSYKELMQQINCPQ